jgi:hypothetical protein
MYLAASVLQWRNQSLVESVACKPGPNLTPPGAQISGNQATIVIATLSLGTAFLPTEMSKAEGIKFGGVMLLNVVGTLISYIAEGSD